MKLPGLKHDFHHALIDSVQVGPRREVTMTIQTLLWEGQTGHRSPNIYLRCGGIVNFDEVKAFFNISPSLEVAWLDYAKSQKSKPGNLFIEIQAERTDDNLIIQCSSLSLLSVSKIPGRITLNGRHNKRLQLTARLRASQLLSFAGR